MVENLKNSRRFSYPDKAFFQPSKMEIVLLDCYFAMLKPCSHKLLKRILFLGRQGHLLMLVCTDFRLLIFLCVSTF